MKLVSILVEHFMTLQKVIVLISNQNITSKTFQFGNLVSTELGKVQNFKFPPLTLVLENFHLKKKWLGPILFFKSKLIYYF